MKKDRYARQRVLPAIGDAGQERLLESRVAVIGCGALGCAQAQLLVRAGVSVLVVDRDIVEMANLHRQVLFDEDDASMRVPKATAAAEKLGRMNSEVRVEARVMDVTADNILSLIDGADLVMDATDNIETRYIINDACVSRSIPWVYGGVSGTEGLVMPVMPGVGPCLRCVFPDSPGPGVLATGEVAGILNTGPTIVAAIQVTAALRLLIGDDMEPYLLSVDPWHGAYRRIGVVREPTCPCCGQRRFDYLGRERGSSALLLPEGKGVEIVPLRSAKLDLAALAARATEAFEVHYEHDSLRIRIDSCEVSVFADGRAIVSGTDDVARARVLYARAVGA